MPEYDRELSFLLNPEKHKFRPSAINYGSDYYWLRSWGQRIDDRLQLSKPIHQWDPLIFLPDDTARSALLKLGVNYPQIIRQVLDALDTVESEYQLYEDGNFSDDVRIVGALDSLQKRIQLACPAIANALISDMDFFETGEELLALIHENTKFREMWSIVGKFEAKRREIFDVPSDPSIWSGCDVRLESDNYGIARFVLLTAHPTIPDHYHEATVYEDQTLSDAEENELRGHLIKIVNAWLRAAKRLTGNSYVDLQTPCQHDTIETIPNDSLPLNPSIEALSLPGKGKRNRLFRYWYVRHEAGHAAIRDRWNNLTEEQRLQYGTKDKTNLETNRDGRGVVIDGIQADIDRFPNINFES